MKKIRFSLPHFPSVFYILTIIFALSFSSFLMFRTFSYDPVNQSMEIASKCWSDFGAHIPMIRSFSLGANLSRILSLRMPEYPIFPGAPIRYHFIFYMVVGILEKIGVRIDWALNIPSIIGFSGLLVCIGILSYKLFKSYAVAILSILFFLFNGSLSFLKFFEKNPLSLSTPADIAMNTSFPSFGPWDQGLISAFWNLNIYTNQRHLAAGFALGLGFITLLLFLQKKSWKQQLPFLLISVPLLSVLPYFHQPMLIIIGLFMIWYFFALKNIRIFLFLTGLISVGPVFVQLLTFSADPSSLVWYPGYLIHAAVTPVLFSTYWFHNLGLHVILIPIGFLLAPKTVKKALFPIFIVFLIANLFKFSVEVAANHKFFNFFMIFGNMLSAYVIILMWNLTCAGNVKNFILLHFLFRKKTTDASLSGTEVRKNFLCNLSARRKAVGFLSCCLIILLLTLSGIIDFFAVINDQKLSIVDIPRNEIATWIAINTPKDAIFLNSSYLYHPASLAGRSIFLGWPYFPWSAGYKENRMPIMNTMYESKNPEVFCPLFHKYNISYITVENVSGNPDLPTISPLYFRSVAAPVFSSAIGTYAIFTTDSLCFSIAL